MQYAYHKASKKQLAYIRLLANQTGEKLPWGYEGWNMHRASVLIRSLERKLEKQRQPDGPEQIGML